MLLLNQCFRAFLAYPKKEAKGKFSEETVLTMFHKFIEVLTFVKGRDCLRLQSPRIVQKNLH